jgi:hypothetical protein
VRLIPRPSEERDAALINDSERGRNSEEAVLEERESWGRWPFHVGGLREMSNETGRPGSGDSSGGGLLGGSVVGLIGMWKYLVVLGKSTVDTEVNDLVWVGGR